MEDRKLELHEVLIHVVGFPNVAQAILKEPSLNAAETMMWASQYGHITIVRWLIEAKVDPDIRGDRQLTGLMVAAHHDRVDIMAFLREAGADINAQNVAGDSALMMASSAASVKAVLWLISIKADLNLRNRSNNTALSIVQPFASTKVQEYVQIFDAFKSAGAQFPSTPKHQRSKRR